MKRSPKSLNQEETQGLGLGQGRAGAMTPSRLGFKALAGASQVSSEGVLHPLEWGRGSHSCCFNPTYYYF